jgi:cysteine desulfurase
MIYLDANSTVPPTPAVIQAMNLAMIGGLGNPSSIHAAGAAARLVLEGARDAVCLMLDGVYPEGVFLNSGGTEGNNAIIRGFAMKSADKPTIVTSAVEHPSVLRPAHLVGSVRTVGVNSEGILDRDRLVSAVSEAPGAVIVSIQWASGETGVIQPIHEIVEAVRAVRNDAFIHVDAAQIVGRARTRMGDIDALTFSGHKLHAPGGSGAFVLRNPEDDRLGAYVAGGGQEDGRRSGTQNVVGAVGMATAIMERMSTFDEATTQMEAMRDAFECAILDGLNDVWVNGSAALRVPNTTNIRFGAAQAEALVGRLDQEDVACSVGSACSSGRPTPSHVLTAMGLTEKEAYSSVRFSFSVLNTMEEALEAAQIVVRIVREMA